MRSASFLGSFISGRSSRGRRRDFPISEVPNIAIKEFTFLKLCHVHSISLKMSDYHGTQHFSGMDQPPFDLECI